MFPVASASRRQFPPTFDQQHTGIADVACAAQLGLDLPSTRSGGPWQAEAAAKGLLVAVARGEARAGRLSATYAAAVDAAVDSGTVKT